MMTLHPLVRTAAPHAPLDPLVSSPFPETCGGPLPERLRRALEHLSGYDLSDVRVHPASPWPARLGARAFVFGGDIHLGPGAEDTLEHEAWHVVQQKQGRVRATRTVRCAVLQLAEVGLNGEEELEREADTMGSMARSLVLGGQELPAREALRIVTIQRPVVQRVILTVANTQYDDTRPFRRELTRQLGANAAVISHQEMADITYDLLNEDLTFPDWAAVLKEVFIRNVGYQVEAMMRRLMNEHQGRYNRQKAAVTTALDQADQDWAADQRKHVLERRFRSEKDYIAFKDSLTYSATEGVLCYSKFSGFGTYQADWRGKQLFKWIIGERQEEPLRMNCWEGVLYALARTHLVPRSYIAWCNSFSQARGIEGVDPYGRLLRFIYECGQKMDYFWGVPHTAFTNKLALRQVSQPTYKEGNPTPKFLVPETRIIPRGRILMLNNGGHVAISTGKLVPITDQGTMNQFGIRLGHGMLEIDGGGSDEDMVESTFVEGTIEELWANRRFYLGHLVVAPFPICPGYQVKLTGVPKASAENNPNYQQAKQAYLDRYRDQIDEEKRRAQEKYDKRVEALTVELRGLPHTPQGNSSEELARYDRYRKLEGELQKTRINYDKQLAAITVKWSGKADNDRGVKQSHAQAQQAARQQETITLDCVGDPYGGLVQL